MFGGEFLYSVGTFVLFWVGGGGGLDSYAKVLGFRIFWGGSGSSFRGGSRASSLCPKLIAKPRFTVQGWFERGVRQFLRVSLVPVPGSFSVGQIYIWLDFQLLTLHSG